jgi:hypothetical protein
MLAQLERAAIAINNDTVWQAPISFFIASLLLQRLLCISRLLCQSSAENTTVYYFTNGFLKLCTHGKMVLQRPSTRNARARFAVGGAIGVPKGRARLASALPRCAPRGALGRPSVPQGRHMRACPRRPPSNEVRRRTTHHQKEIHKARRYSYANAVSVKPWHGDEHATIISCLPKSWDLHTIPADLANDPNQSNGTFRLLLLARRRLWLFKRQSRLL